jgi:hypothetical protein
VIDTRAGSRFRLSAKRTSPFKSAGACVQSTTRRRAVHIKGSTAGYTMFRSRVKGTGYPLHYPVSSSVLLPCATACRHISAGLYHLFHCRSTFWFCSQLYIKYRMPLTSRCVFYFFEESTVFMFTVFFVLNSSHTTPKFQPVEIYIYFLICNLQIMFRTNLRLCC